MGRIGIYFGVGGEVSGYTISEVGDVGASGGTQVAAHSGIIAKSGGSSTYFSTHIANSTFSGARKAIGSFAKILNDIASASFYGQDTGYFEDNIFGRSPAVEFSGEFDTDEFGHFQFPRQSRHHITSVCTTYANGYHSQAACIYGVAVCAYHHTAGEGVIFQHYLMNNTCTGFPKSDAVFVGYRSQEIIHFVIFLIGTLQIFF